MVDDLGKEWISSYGAEQIKTRNIDFLAENGLKFHNVYSMPQCTPTRVTLLTGQYPFRHGWVNHWDVPRWGGGCHFDPNLNPILPASIRAQGYKTAIAGKWQVNDFRVQPEILNTIGFDEYCMWTGAEGQNPPSINRYYDPYIYTKEGSRTYQNEFGPDIFTDFLCDFIKKNEDQNWFAYYSMALTHGPLTNTPNEKTDSLDANARFHEMVEYMDSLVGRLITTINDSKQADNTLIVFTTDNGSPGGITGIIGGKEIKGGKSKTTENGICNPFITYWPAQISKEETDALVDFTDIFPTFIDLAGGNNESDLIIDGKSFKSVLTGETKDSGRDFILAMGGQNKAKLSDAGVENEWVFRDRVIRNERYKAYVNTSGEIEKMVDLKSDPFEKNNLLPCIDADCKKSMGEIKEWVKSMPSTDNEPIYTPLPYESWYLETHVKSKIWKKGEPKVN